MTRARTAPLVVMISGSGSNLQALLDATDEGRLNARVAGVISDRSDAYGLQRAARANTPARVIEPKALGQGFDAALIDAIEAYEPRLVILAGYMRILSPRVVQRFQGRMLNIHPSLLPKYRGLDTYRRVLEAGDALHGSSVHFVTEELDGGPVIAQAVVPVRPGDDAAALSARVQACEHTMYPTVVGWFADGRLSLTDDGIRFDGDLLSRPVQRENW